MSLILMALSGNYQPQIDQNTFDRTGLVEDNNGANALYSCGGGRSGVIGYLQLCSGGCQDNGSGTSDQCV